MTKYRPSFTRHSHSTFLFLLFILIGCGQHSDYDQAKIKVSSVIIGEVDWSEVTTFPDANPVRVNSRAVGEVRLASGGRCTGFLINDDTLMTNDHCVSSHQEARGLTVIFNNEAGVAKSVHKAYDCSEFIGSDRDLDFALVRCRENPGESYGHVSLSTVEAQRLEELYLIQQNCDYFTQRSCDWTKKYAAGTVTRRQGPSLVHNADTLGGSSGSPVFSAISHHVIAIHHAGLGNNGSGRGIENYGISMSDIVAHIDAFYPSVELYLDGQNTDAPEHTSLANALSLASGNFELVRSGDSHYYRFDLSRRTLIDIKIDFSHRRGDLDLYLHYLDGRTIARSAGVSNQEQLRGYLPAGQYYIRVEGFRGATGPYELKAELY